MNRQITINYETLFQQAQYSFLVPGLITSIVHRRIIDFTARDKGIEVSVEELRQEADQFRVVWKLYKAEDTWLWLQKNHMSLDDLEDILKNKLLSRKLAEYMFSDQIDTFFYAHQLDLETVALYDVVVKEENLAMELSFALQEGELSFHEIARQYIQDPELRRAGGYRGVKTRKELKPEIAAAAFAATPPLILQPITSSDGTHLILVEEIIKPQISNEKIRAKILSGLFSNWIQQQSKQVDISTCFKEEHHQLIEQSLET